MKLLNFAKKLQLEIVTEEDKDKEIDIEGAYIGDLLSIVMGKAKEKNVWITIQTHLNILAVAELIDISAIIIAENMEINDETIEKAKKLEIPLLKSKENAYKIACGLYEMGI